jgi:hypothetical protein
MGAVVFISDKHHGGWKDGRQKYSGNRGQLPTAGDEPRHLHFEESTRGRIQKWPKSVVFREKTAGLTFAASHAGVALE